MAFPATPLPVRSQLFLGGEWIDFGDSTLIRDQINIRRGMAPEGVRPDPSRCFLSLRNQSGDLSPSNPFGQYYGQIGENTPLRVVLDEADDDFDRTSSNGWGTSSSGHTWATSGGLASAYAVSGGNATIAVSAVNSIRLTALNVSLADCDVAATFKPGVVAAGDEFVGEYIDMALLLRYQDDSNYYYTILRFREDGTVQAVIAQRKSGVNTALAATGDLGTYTAVSQWRIRAKICGKVITVRAWDAVNGSEPSTFNTWVVDNDSDAILAAGKVGCRVFLAPGNTNTLPVTVTYSDFEVVHHRYNGEVPVWPVDWDLSGKNVWAPITAAGLLRRVNKAKESFSPLRRLLQGTSPVYGGVVGGIGTNSSYRRPVGYWPMEEGSGSTIASSGLPGGQAMTVSGTVAWAADTTIVGSDSLPQMMDGTATLSATVVAPNTGAWTVGAALKPPTLSSNWTALSWTVAGNSLYNRFELRVRTDSTYDLVAFNGSTPTTLGNGAFKDLTTLPTWISVQAAAFDADTEYRVTTTADNYATDYSIIVSTAAGSTPGYPTGISVFSVAGGASDTATIGHVTVWDGQFTILADAGVIDALRAYPGDQGHLRLARLFQQDGIPFIYVGEQSDQMGTQPTGALPSLVDDVLAVDKGLMFEARDEHAIVYMTRRARENLATTLALTYGASGHVAPGFKPVPDDRDIVNDLTVRREGGASGRYELTTGRRAVSRGRYPRNKTLPLYNDIQPYQHAAWETIAAAWDEPRYPSVNVNMARVARDAATVYQQAKRLDVGTRLTVASPPLWLPPGTIGLQAAGLSETIGDPKTGAYAWTISAQTVPDGPFQVGAYGTSAMDSRYDTESSTLASGVDADDTTLSVATAAGHSLWVTGSGAPTFPFDIKIAGVRIRVTAISGTSSPQTFTVTRSVDGQDKALGSGEPVSLWTPARYAF